MNLNKGKHKHKGIGKNVENWNERGSNQRTESFIWRINIILTTLHDDISKTVVLSQKDKFFFVSITIWYNW